MLYPWRASISVSTWSISSQSFMTLMSLECSLVSLLLYCGRGEDDTKVADLAAGGLRLVKLKLSKLNLPYSYLTLPED